MRAHATVLKHYHRQQGGSGKGYDADKLLDTLEKDDYQLDEEYADAVEHDIVADAVSKAHPTIGKGYKELVKKYIEATDSKTKADIGKQLKLYRSMGGTIGISDEAMHALKRDGFTAPGLSALLDNIDKGIEQVDSEAFMKQVPKKVAYGEIDRLGRETYTKGVLGKKFNPERVKAAGVDAARGIIAMDRRAKGDEDAFYEMGGKQFYTKPKK